MILLLLALCAPLLAAAELDWAPCPASDALQLSVAPCEDASTRCAYDETCLRCATGESDDCSTYTRVGALCGAGAEEQPPAGVEDGDEDCHFTCSGCDGPSFMECTGCSPGFAFTSVPGYASGFCALNATCEGAFVSTPLNASEPQGTQMQFYTRRITTDPSATDQVWLLNGGPGEGGYNVLFFAAYQSMMVGASQYFVPDHRGVGQSDYLACPSAVYQGDPVAYSEACLEELQQSNFTWAQTETMDITNAANDLVLAIEATGGADAQVIVHGFSYGTAWGHRAAQLAQGSGLVDGLVLDGVVAQGYYMIDDLPVASNTSGVQLMAYCEEQSAACIEAFPSPAWGSLAAALDTIADNENECAQALLGPHVSGADAKEANLETIKDFMFNGMAAQRTYSVQGILDYRPYWLAFVARAARCEDDDVDPVQSFLAFVMGGGDDDDDDGGYDDDERLEMDSKVVYYAVVLADMMPSPAPSLDQWQAVYDTIWVGSDAYPGFQEVQDLWPAYQHDEYYGTFLDDDAVGLLVVNGDLDAETPVWSATKMFEGITAGQKTMAVIEAAGHAVANRNPCGLELLRQFHADPLAALNTSCVEDWADPVNWEGVPGLNSAVFGTEEFWPSGVEGDDDSSGADDDGGGGGGGDDDNDGGGPLLFVSLMVCALAAVAGVLFYARQRLGLRIPGVPDSAPAPTPFEDGYAPL